MGREDMETVIPDDGDWELSREPAESGEDDPWLE